MNLGQTFTQKDINDGLIAYHNQQFNGTDDSFTFAVSDDGGLEADGAGLLSPAIFNISVEDHNCTARPGLVGVAIATGAIRPTGVPTMSQTSMSKTAIFDGHCANNCDAIVDMSLDIEGIILKEDYIGTVHPRSWTHHRYWNQRHSPIRW